MNWKIQYFNKVNFPLIDLLINIYQQIWGEGRDSPITELIWKRNEPKIVETISKQSNKLCHISIFTFGLQQLR